MHRRMPIVLVFLTLLPACASAPRTYSIERSQPYGHPYPDVWAAVVDIATADLPVSTSTPTRAWVQSQPSNTRCHPPMDTMTADPVYS